MMSRFLFATIGSLGDLNPYIAIARELLLRGHEVTIATIGDYQTFVENAGINFHGVPPSFADLGDYGKLINRLLDGGCSEFCVS